MSAHYAMCKYDDATGSYIPLEVRPITDTLKNDDPLYQEGFQSGAASRDAEVDQLRAELVKALAACKVKDEALASCGFTNDSTDSEMCGSYYDAELVQQALAIQPDDSALKAWLGEAVAWKDAAAKNRIIFPPTKPEDGDDGWLPLYSPKLLK